MTTATLTREVTPEAKPSVTTAEILALVARVFDRYVIFPSDEARTAAILWTAHTHAMDAWESTPRLAVMSPDPGSGKTRVLEILAQLTPNADYLINVTPSVLWRILDAGNVTLLFDEADTVFGRNGSASAHRQLRAILNAGHRRGGTIKRAVGAEGVTDFSVWGAVALAGLGHLPATLTDRSIVIPMRKRTGDESVEPFRPSEAEPRLALLKKALEVWSLGAIEDLRRARPEMPVDDRQADVWAPLIAIADLAGEPWPDRARDACIYLCAESKGTSVGAMLLGDVAAVWPTRADRMTTKELLAALHGVNGWHPGNLDAGSLARHLAPFDVYPGTIRVGRGTAKGYKVEALLAAWETYLLPSPVTL